MADPKIRFDIAAHAEGGGEVDRLAASLEKLDQALDPQAAARAQLLARELQELGAQQAAVARFQELGAAVDKARADMVAADAAVAALRAEIETSGGATTAQSGRLEKLGAAATAAAADFRSQTAALDASRGKLSALGIDADAAAEAEAGLGSATKALRTELAGLGASLQGVRAGELVDELRQLGQQQQAIETFRNLDTAVDKAQAALKSAEGALEAYRTKLLGVEAPTAAQVSQQQRLGFAVDDARAKLTAQTAALDTAGAGLQRLGVETSDLAAAEDRLRTASQAVLAQVRELGQQQAAVTRFQELATATERARVALTTADAAVDAFKAGMQSAVAPTAAEATQLAALATESTRAQAALRTSSAALTDAGAAASAAGVGTDRLRQIQAAARAEATTGAAATRQVATALRDQDAAAKQSAGSLEAIRDKLQGLQTLGIAGILGSQTVQLLKGVAETADAYGNLRSRIQLVTGEGAPLQRAFDGVYQIAIRTNSSLENTGTLFARIAQAGKEIGVTQADALRLTETINQAVQISGGAAGAADAAVTQLIQGLQSGVLRGEEFNSVMEQAPRLALALAAGLGVTTGELRKMANEGELTSATVIQALRGQASVLSKEFQTLPATVGRAVQNLRTEWERLVGTFNDGQGATSVVAAGIDKLAKNLDVIARLAAEAGAALAAGLAIKGAAALRALTAEASIATLSMQALRTSIASIPTTVNIAIAVTGFEVGFQLGEMLRENSELARTFGVGVTEFLTGLVNDLQFLKEAAAAVFTDDTISASFDRYKARAEQQRAIFAELYDDAKKSPAEIRRAADEAAAAARDVGAAGVQAGQQVQAGTSAAAGGYAGLTAAAGSAASAVQQVGQGAGTLAPLTAEAKAAQAALLEIATVAKVQLPTVGATAAQQAAILVDMAGKSRQVASVLATELPAAIDKLSGAGLDQFRASLVAALSASIEQSRRLSAELTLAGKSGGQALAEAQAKAVLLQTVLADTGKRAAQALGVDVAGLATGLSEEFRKAEDNLSLLIRSMPALKAAGVDAGAAVGQALANMLDGAKNQAEIDAITARLTAMGKAGLLSGADVAAGLRAAADKALELKDKLDDLQPGVHSLREAARKAGVDFGEMTTGISKGFADNTRALSDLVKQVVASGTSAQRASPLLAEALNKALEAAKTKEEVDLLRKVIDQAGAAGKLFGSDLSDALDTAKQKVEQLTPVMRQVASDAKRLGLDFRDAGTEGSNAAEQNIRAYERLKSSGKLTAQQLQDAFIALAKKQLEANGGVVTETMRAEAEMRGLAITTDQSGRVIIQSLDHASGSIGSFSGSVRKATEDVIELGRQTKAVSVLTSNMGATGSFGKDANGNTFTANGQAVPPNAPGNWVYTLDSGRYSERGHDANGRTLPGGWYRTDAPGGGTGPFGGTAGAPAAPTSPAPAPATVVPSPAPAPQMTVPINVTIGGRTTQLVTNTPADANLLIQALESAYRAGGG